MTTYNCIKFSITSGSSVEDTSEEPLDDYAVWYDLSHTWTQNPSGNKAWTWDDIENLEFGTSLYYDSNAIQSMCTQVYLEVQYTPGEEESTASGQYITDTILQSTYIPKNSIVDVIIEKPNIEQHHLIDAAISKISKQPYSIDTNIEKTNTEKLYSLDTSIKKETIKQQHSLDTIIESMNLKELLIDTILKKVNFEGISLDVILYEQPRIINRAFTAGIGTFRTMGEGTFKIY